VESTKFARAVVADQKICVTGKAVGGQIARSILDMKSAYAYDLVMLDWSQCSVVERRADKVSGAWLFKGSRVPVKALFENLEGGATIGEFLDWFPGITREQVQAVLAHAEQSLIEA
jgi:uncharacterized protein (DUF433 family)